MEQEDSEGKTPLHCCADYGYAYDDEPEEGVGVKNTVRVLIKNGANTKNRGSLGMTPSEYASEIENDYISRLVDFLENKPVLSPHFQLL